MVTEPLYTVFEAINDKHREIFVAITREQVFATVARIQKDRPDVIRHWDLNEVINVRSVEFDLTEKEARDFVEHYVKQQGGGVAISHRLDSRFDPALATMPVS